MRRLILPHTALGLSIRNRNTSKRLCLLLQLLVDRLTKQESIRYQRQQERGRSCVEGCWKSPLVFTVGDVAEDTSAEEGSDWRDELVGVEDGLPLLC